MNIPHQSFTTWKAIITVLQLFAILATILRLAHRHRRRTIWMDDLTVTPPLVMSFIAVVAMWVLYVEKDSTSTAKGTVALYWLASISWMTILWFTRISLVLTMTRIFPDWGTIRRNCRGISVAFGIFYVGFMCWLCTSACVPSSSDSPTSQPDILDCSNERHFLVIASFAADIFSCSLLVIYPIFVLFLLPLPRGQYKLILGFLCGCVAVLLSSALYGVFCYSAGISGPGQPFVARMLSQIEAAISLLACDVVAFVTYLYRHDSRPDAIDDRIEWKKPKLPESGANNLTAARGLPMTMIHSRDRKPSEESGQWFSHENFPKTGVKFS